MQNLLSGDRFIMATLNSTSKEILVENKNAKPGITRVISPVTGSLFFILALFVFSSCSSTKNITYFENLQKDTTLRNLVSKNFEPKIQKNDLLGITVASLSPDNAFYNAAPNIVGTSSGYLVDENGNIPFAKIGSLHVEGMTRKELKDTVEKSLIPYLKDAVVGVGFLNRHVTMLGAVTPMVIPIPGDNNMTILDALAASGDIGAKGRIDNVLIMRENNDSKEFKRLNLGDNSIFFSPYYYVQPNDIIYVEPAKIKTKLTTGQIISYIASAVSLLILLLDRVIK